MKLFEEPKLVVVTFSVEDVVTTSGDPEFTFWPEPCVSQ